MITVQRAFYFIGYNLKNKVYFSDAQKSQTRGETRMNKLITIGAIVGLVAAGTALYLQSQQKSDNVKVGYMTTLSGGAGIIGKQMQNAVILDHY